MVDAAANARKRISADDAPISPDIGLSADVLSGAQAIAAYKQFSANAIHGPAQSCDWISGWTEAHGTDTIVALVSFDSEPILALALEVIRHRGLVEAIYPGGRHANGNFAAIARDRADTLPGGIVDAITEAIAAAHPDVDVLRLERQQPEIGGVANPLITANSAPSPNISLAANLDGGFDAYLERHSGKRKRKKHRSDGRKFDEQGGFRCFLAQSPDETDALLDAFFVMKAKRFRERGIFDVFADPDTRTFFKKLFARHAGSAAPGYVVQALEIGGAIRAVTGNSICEGRVVCEFSGFIEDKGLSTSPGDFLFFENIAWTCENGHSVYDFSVGDEFYKRQWCDFETVQFDTLVPLSMKGRVASAGLGVMASAKRRLKSSPRLWAAAKTLRRAI